MTIVDQQHASQVVTSKGKVYKFDAIECMINFLHENDKGPYAHTLVSDFTNPGELIDAHEVSFLISKDIPSPMGAFLSAFNNEEAALKTKNDSEGAIYNWSELLVNLKK
jgi:copper chaperone NosL